MCKSVKSVLEPKQCVVAVLATTVTETIPSVHHNSTLNFRVATILEFCGATVEARIPRSANALQPCAGNRRHFLVRLLDHSMHTPTSFTL
jgi:hypothetical protein